MLFADTVCIYILPLISHYKLTRCAASAGCDDSAQGPVKRIETAYNAGYEAYYHSYEPRSERER